MIYLHIKIQTKKQLLNNEQTTAPTPTAFSSTAEQYGSCSLSVGVCTPRCRLQLQRGSVLYREQPAEGVLQGPVARQARGVATGCVLGQGGTHVVQVPGTTR